MRNCSLDTVFEPLWSLPDAAFACIAFLCSPLASMVRSVQIQHANSSKSVATNLLSAQPQQLQDDVHVVVREVVAFPQRLLVQLARFGTMECTPKTLESTLSNLNHSSRPRALRVVLKASSPVSVDL
eukprot:6230904-Amphidinium_carterae.1